MTIPVTVAELDAMRSELDVLRGNEVRVQELSKRVQELESTEGQIAALEGKGYAVVKLPAVSHDEYGDVRVDVPGSDTHDGYLRIESARENYRGVPIPARIASLGIPSPIRIGGARNYAAALLAAANAAEQVQS